MSDVTTVGNEGKKGVAFGSIPSGIFKTGQFLIYKNASSLFDLFRKEVEVLFILSFLLNFKIQ